MIPTTTARAPLTAHHIKRQTSMEKRTSLHHTMSSTMTPEMENLQSANIMTPETEATMEMESTIHVVQILFRPPERIVWRLKLKEEMRDKEENHPGNLQGKY